MHIERTRKVVICIPGSFASKQPFAQFAGCLLRFFPGSDINFAEIFSDETNQSDFQSDIDTRWSEGPQAIQAKATIENQMLTLSFEPEV
jgi:hypothetical protein